MHTEPKPSHGSAEWLAVRHRDPQGRARLTASVAGVLFDCHPFITPAELATQMLAETPPEASWSDAIERGTDLEPVILQTWHRRNQGRLVTIGTERVWANSVMQVNGRWVANLDDWCYEPDQAFDEYEVCPLEAKTTNKVTDGILPYWVWQGVAQRWCLNGTPGRVEWAWYDASFTFKQATQWVTQDDLDRLVAAGEEWLSYIDLDMVPPSVVLSAQQVATLHPKPELAKTELPDDARYLVWQLAEARRLKKEAEEAEDGAKSALAAHMARAEVGIIDGLEIVSWKASKDRTSFDASRFQAEHPDLWQQYQKTSPGARTMRILKGFDEMGDGDDGTDEPF